MPTISFLSQCSTQIQGIKIGKKSNYPYLQRTRCIIKRSLIVYQKQFGPVNNINKFARYKINIQQPVPFTYNNKERTENCIMESILSGIAEKRLYYNSGWLLSYCGEHHDRRQCWLRRDSLRFHFLITVCHEGKSRPKFKQKLKLTTQTASVRQSALWEMVPIC